MSAASFTAFVTRLRVQLTPAQSVLYRIAFDGAEPADLEAEDRELARQLFGDIDTIPELARSQLCLVKGARIGGSRFGALRLLHLALTLPLDTLAPGEIASALIVAPDQRLARQSYRYALGTAQSVPAIAKRLTNVRADGFVLRRDDGRSVTLECLPATRGGSATRGRSLVGALLSESAFFRDPDSGVVNDAEIHRSIAPRLLPGAQLILESTPWLRNSLLHHLFQENYGHPTTAIAAHAPTLLMRSDPRMRALVEAERARDPENAAREFDAQFLDAASSEFFDYATLSACIDPDLELGQLPDGGEEVTCGADLGFTRNSSALVICHRTDAGIIVADVIEKKPAKGQPLRPSEVLAEFAEHISAHGASYLMADGHYKASSLEALANSSIGFVDAPTEPATAFIRARNLMREGRVRIPAGADRLLRQLREVTSRPSPGGRISIQLPRWRTGEHGDVASAYVLALAQLAGETVEAPGPPPGTPEYARAQEEARREARRKAVEEDHLRRADPRYWRVAPSERLPRGYVTVRGRILR